MRAEKVVRELGPASAALIDEGPGALTPNDLWATVYRHLGINYDDSFPDHRGRPMPILPEGDPIAELL